MVVEIMVPFGGPYYITAPTVSGTQKGTLILTTTHLISGLASGLKSKGILENQPRLIH